MARGVAGLARSGGRAAAVDEIEVKAGLPGDVVRRARARWKLDRGEASVRRLHFFDTPQLDLFAAGLVARARRIRGGEHDSTVKLRPVTPAAIGEQWRAFRGFKVETDASEREVVAAASFSMPIERGRIRRVARGDAGVGELFDDEQRLFLLGMAGVRVDFERVVAFPPIRARRWKVDDPDSPWPLGVEIWRREDGERLVEVSAKVPIAEAASAVRELARLLEDVGVERDSGPLARVRWALSTGPSRRGRKGR